MAAFKNKRLQKELQKMTDSLPPGISLVSAPDLASWTMDISVLEPSHPIYANCTFRLALRFGERYPIEAPEAYFVTTSTSTGTTTSTSSPSKSTTTSSSSPSINTHQTAAATTTSSSSPSTTTTTTPPRTIPLHPHIYSNGMVCLDLLGSGWSPVQNVESVCVSLQSMLTGNVRAERPEGDAEFCRRYVPGRSKGIGFLYDDDKV